jgi:hypothetical protein
LPTFSNRGAASALLLLASGCGGEESKLIQGETADGQSHERNVEPGEELQADQPRVRSSSARSTRTTTGRKIAIIKAERKPAGAVFTVKITNSTGEIMDVSAISIIASYGPGRSWRSSSG